MLCLFYMSEERIVAVIVLVVVDVLFLAIPWKIQKHFNPCEWNVFPQKKLHENSLWSSLWRYITYFYRPEIVHTLAGLITIKQSNTYILYSIKVVLTNIRVQVTFQNQPFEFLSHVTSWSYRYMVHNCFSHKWKWKGATCDRIKKQIELFLHSHKKIKLQSCPILRILNADNLFCFVVQLWN